MASKQAKDAAYKIIKEIDKVSEQCGGPRFMFHEVIDETAETIDKEMQKMPDRIPESLARALEVMFEHEFWDWREIQGSISMDFPVEFDNVMRAIEMWKCGTTGMTCHGKCNQLTEGIVRPGNLIECTVCSHVDIYEEKEVK